MRTQRKWKQIKRISCFFYDFEWCFFYVSYCMNWPLWIISYEEISYLNIVSFEMIFDLARWRQIKKVHKENYRELKIYWLPQVDYIMNKKECSSWNYLIMPINRSQWHLQYTGFVKSIANFLYGCPFPIWKIHGKYI